MSKRRVYPPHHRHSPVGYELPMSYERAPVVQMASPSEVDKCREPIPTGEEGGERA